MDWEAGAPRRGETQAAAAAAKRECANKKLTGARASSASTSDASTIV
jgi:hypothetical protein